VLPLSEQHSYRSQVAQLSRPASDNHELGYECVKVILGQEGNPWRGLRQQRSYHLDVLGSDQAGEQARSEFHHGCIAVKLLDPHQGKITSIPTP
jgi:hypothetical protein